METFTKLFGSLLVFVYHCFDRIVINGYLSGLSRPEQVVYFFRDVVGVPVIDKTVLSQRTDVYRNWVEAYATNHKLPVEWADKGVRKEDYVQPHLRRMVKNNAYGVYFIFKSMEQGATFRISVPKFPTKDPTHRILAHQRSRYTHYYFYVRDEVLGPLVIRVASLFPFQTTYYLNGHSYMEQELKRRKIGFRKNDNAFLAVDNVEPLQAAADRLSPEVIRKQLDYWTLIVGPKFSKKERAAMNLSRFYAVQQIEYCRNFIFKRHFPIHKILERSCELGLWRLTAHKISEIFGVRLTKKFRGKLSTVVEQVEHGHHVYRAYWENAFLKAVRKVLHLPAQRTVLQQPEQLQLEEGSGPFTGGAGKVSSHHGPLRRVPSSMAQGPRGLPVAAANRSAHHYRLGALPRYQNPRDPDHTLIGSAAARRRQRQRLDLKADSPSRPHHLPPRREIL